MKSLFPIKGSLIVIPHIQNIYSPEKHITAGWSVGFKYNSGFFDFFYFKTLSDARKEYSRLIKAVEDYYDPQKISYNILPIDNENLFGPGRIVRAKKLRKILLKPQKPSIQRLSEKGR